jgi:hypothetical protein
VADAGASAISGTLVGSGSAATALPTDGAARDRAAPPVDELLTGFS